METDIPTVSEVVRRAATICDPAGDDVAVTALVERFSDDDRPARSVDGLHSLIHEELNLADPAADDPAAAMTAACAAWLATNIEQGDDRELVLREASRVAFDGRPPEPIAGWLERQGVSV